MDTATLNETSFDYDVSLSFAGEDREYVRQVAERLRERGLRVFYDEYEKVNLWGKDLYAHLDHVYQHAARFCVLFVSSHYAAKVWTNHERQSAQARAISAHEEYVLPARFDDTVVPGLRPTVGYVDLRRLSPEELAELIKEKVGKRSHVEYLPPIPNLLFNALDAKSEGRKNVVYSYAHDVLQTLRRMSTEERDLVFHFILHACPAELPTNLHINVDLLRRILGVSPADVKLILSQLASLGVFCSLREDDEHKHLGSSELIVMEWHDMREGGGNIIDVASAMVEMATAGYCEKHGVQALRRLDFGQLSDATALQDRH